MSQALDGTDNSLLHLLHAGGGDLHYDDIIKPVYHQARETIAVAEYPAIEGFIKQSLPQTQCRLHAIGQPLGRHAVSGITADQAAADQGVGVHKRYPHRFVVRGPNLHLRAGLKLRQRAAAGIHLVAVHPQVTGPETTFCAFAQVENGKIHQRLFLSGHVFSVGSRIHEALQLAFVGQLYLEHPAIAVGVFVHDFRLVFQLFIDLDDLAGYRAENV